ncbi:C6 zinc finger domain-containing protein [Pochonia chlamydosporia 170]|uniref:C6 zinc finger domain-containing protein n=1 Tax=Pochonia chlamydosporia 170 TaxID=1380566 RepID=A0A179FJV6_METCM|nr:C6 zinc finger domain-containing protein [Pochonia chlamydosporia 170]OAQ65323.1 C6 zinc finger domain-containing protein [Pochonia chlamydosporia 170]
MYELAESPAAGVEGAENSIKAANGYTTHLMGAMMLMELRGPDMNNSPLAHSLFLGLRRYMLLGSLMNHKDTFISHPQWRERPWAVYPKNLLDVCLDALFEMPAVLRQWDAVSHESNDAVIQHKCAAILDRCNELDADLQNWYVEYEQSWSGPLYQTAFCTLKSQFDNDELGKVFPISYHFPVFTIGYVLITYWSGMMVVHNIAMAAQYKLAYVASMSPSGTLSACAAAKEHTDIWLDMVRNMCQSVEYFMGQETGRIGPTTAMGIMQGCMASLSGEPELWGRERGWIVEMMGRIGKRLNLPRHDILWK